MQFQPVVGDGQAVPEKDDEAPFLFRGEFFRLVPEFPRPVVCRIQVFGNILGLVVDHFALPDFDHVAIRQNSFQNELPQFLRTSKPDDHLGWPGLRQAGARRGFVGAEAENVCRGYVSSAFGVADVANLYVVQVVGAAAIKFVTPPRVLDVLVMRRRMEPQSAIVVIVEDFNKLFLAVRADGAEQFRWRLRGHAGVLRFSGGFKAMRSASSSVEREAQDLSEPCRSIESARLA